ncbi:hypothetical protein RYX36_016540 [Vicia faba]
MEFVVVDARTEHSGTTEHADNGSVNLIGAHSNGFHSYQSKFPPEFLNIQKKRRTEKGKTSNTHITSSVNTKNGVPPIFAPEDAQVHPYASNNSSWMYGLGYNAAVCRIINESRENHMHSTQTFDEFKLSLRRMAEISLLPNQTCDYNSLMRIRNCIEPNYNAKQLDYSDRQTIREAERPQTCTDVLVEDMHVSCAKKKRSRKRGVLSSSMRPNKDEMQQCHNSALGNHQLTLGKPSAVCRIINESRENHMHSTQTFDEFKLSLRRMAEISLLPNQTCDYNSLMRIRNCIEPNYNAKQLDYSDRQTIREAERPQTCTDVLVEDMHVSCAKKKRSRKRGVLSSSMRPNKDEMQQCHNSALGNHQLTLGKPSGTARRVVQKITYNVEALIEQFRQLNINTGGKELALYGQTALVPFQGSFDPIKKNNAHDLKLILMRKLIECGSFCC